MILICGQVVNCRSKPAILKVWSRMPHPGIWTTDGCVPARSTESDTAGGAQKSVFSETLHVILMLETTRLNGIVLRLKLGYVYVCRVNHSSIQN